MGLGLMAKDKTLRKKGVWTGWGSVKNGLTWGEEAGPQLFRLGTLEPFSPRYEISVPYCSEGGVRRGHEGGVNLTQDSWRAVRRS